MTLVVEHFKVFVFVFKNRSGFALDVQGGVGKGLTAELQRHLVFVIAVDVAITTGPNEIAHVQIALLRHHVCEQCIAGNVERHTQENVGAALVQLAAELALATGLLGRRHIKLKEGMAGHEGHLGQLGHVPRTHNDAT